MVKTLQKKFIFASMMAITILIVILLGTVNVVNIIRLNNHNENLMDMLSGGDRMFMNEDFGGRPEDAPEDFEPGDINPKDVNAEDFESGVFNNEDMDFVPDSNREDIKDTASDKQERSDSRKSFRLFNPVLNEDDRLSAVYFVVRLDENDEVIYTDVSNISTIDEETASEYAKQVLNKGKEKGKIDDFKYAISDAPDGHGKTIVFLDIKSESQSILAVVVVSVGIGLLCWVSMLLLIITLSKKAIRPIASNIERQKQFITDAGHEIKTPLAIILANTDAMELHNGETKWSKNIRKQTTRLSELMQRMLSLAKMDEGTAKLKFEEMDISKLVNDLVSAFKEPAKNKNITIEKDIEENICYKADKESITQLINILTDNAVKYADEESTIKIKLRKHEKHVKLSVSNKCSNLPDIQPEKMFDRFYRGDSARTQKGNGFGIGLSVAQAVVEAHKGHIRAVYPASNTIKFEVEI
ncbi:MAG: HAMP domain-containing histidine kinase [Lachnospiraceae bacterium]|nr:HAMP domain-containing histidine kinase [Lachnospiraceae bacterium]